MAAKRCLKCGSTNPRFFTHCVKCGAKLGEGVRPAGKTLAYLKTGLIVCAAILLVIFVILPLYEHSISIGRNASAAISAPQTPPPRIESVVGRPVGNEDFQITVTSSRNGDNTYNSNRFYIVTVFLKNTQDTGNITVSKNDFILVDSEGNTYAPYGIGSKVRYDIGPSQQISSAELTFVIPQRVSVKEILFTFPEPSVLSANRPVVAFAV